MTAATPRKKLIEVSIPLEAIDAEARRRKQKAPKGYPTSIHKYWAQRPIAACRAVLFAQLVDDPSSWRDRFPTEAAQDGERKRLHDVMKDMVRWEASNDERILSEARWEIARSVAWGLGEEPPPRGDGRAIFKYLQTKAPPVYDPFCGAGSIPLEAQRLGLRTYGSDLNPLAVLVSKALVEIPPKFSGLAPVNPKAQAEVERGGRWSGRGAQGLAEDVRYYGAWLRSEAHRRIGHLYPTVKLSDDSEAMGIAWIWARTVRSPDPAAKGVHVPLLSTYLLSTKEGKKVWIEPLIDPTSPDGYRFAIRYGTLSKEIERRLKNGTKSEGRGSSFTCLLTGSAIDGDYIKAEGMAGRMAIRMVAVVAERDRSRIYLEPDSNQQIAAELAKEYQTVTAAREGFLNQPVPERLTGGTCYAYGLTSYGKLFTDRQLVALTTFSDLVSEVRQKAREDAIAASMMDDRRPLSEGGQQATAYADAIATYLAFAVDRMATYGSTLCKWLTKDNALAPSIPQHGITMSYDFAEGNPFGKSSAEVTQCVSVVASCLDNVPADGFSSIEMQAAQDAPHITDFVLATDPPYYDNIAYADISDFFYVWVARTLRPVWPNLLRRLVTPKQEELTALQYRHGTYDNAENFFINGMKVSLGNLSERSRVVEPMTVYYAFRQTESGSDGVSSRGWASFLQAMWDSGIGLDGTWPLRTELTSALKTDVNSLASSILLVCRKRAANTDVITRAEFIRTLKRELPDAIADIRKAGVGPVDMQQSVIGPGMGIFSRLAGVLEDDDNTMSVKTALTLVNRVWEEIENELEANFDAETQVALAWFSTYGFDAKPSGELITLANAKNIPLNALFSSKVFQDHHGKAGLTPRDKLPKHWEPASDRSLTVWECLQHTIRVLKVEDGGAEAAGRLIAQMGPKATEARLLAERLYQIAAQKGWQQEALVYNELAEEWPTLEEFAQNIAKPDQVTEPAQARLL